MEMIKYFRQSDSKNVESIKDQIIIHEIKKLEQFNPFKNMK